MGQMPKMKQESRDKGLTQVLIWGAVAVTLGFWTTFQDPFNVVKLALILMTAAWLAGHLITKRNRFFKTAIKRRLLIFVSIFLFTLVLAIFATENKRVAFIGDNQRNNGFLMYLGLSVILLSAAISIHYKNIYKLFKAAIFMGGLLAVYGLFQINGVDIVKWNNPYNAVISTLGNPNFAAAVMAIIATLSFGTVLNSSFSRIFRIWSLTVCLASLVAIYFSDARQGLIGIIIGFGVYLSIFIHGKSRLLGLSFMGVGLITAIFSILGMLQVGPLTSFLYKGSVTVRGFYWRAGIEMFKNNPIFGVGLDSYGSYFKQYREVGYVLNYGFEITSSNAHNVPIQMFATGGLLVGVAYLLLNVFVFWRAIVGLKSAQGNQRLVIASIFSAWLVYQATSFISIDAPGIAIWGWLLAGCLIGLSETKSEALSAFQNNDNKNHDQQPISSLQPVLSYSFLILAMFFALILFRGETNMFYTRLVYNPQEPANSLYLKESATKTINQLWVNPLYKITSASFLVNSGFVDEGISELEKMSVSNKRYEGSLFLLATYYTQLNKLDLAIEKRIAISNLDPWDAANYLQLGKLYKSIGDLEKMNQVRNKILSFAPDTPEGQAAKLDLIS
jgi:O-antigen ligase